MSNENFPVPVGDWIVIKKIVLDDNLTAKAKKADIKVVSGLQPKNIRDIEERKAEQQLTYLESETKVLARWPAHPNQGIIKAVGPDVKLDLHVGDQIMLRGDSGEWIIWKKKLYWCHKPHEIFAKVQI